MGQLFSLTYPTATVLIAICSGHRYGFDIMDASALPDGTLYLLLPRLERRAVLDAKWDSAEIAIKKQRAPKTVLHADSARRGINCRGARSPSDPSEDLRRRKWEAEVTYAR
ncbi:MAG: hypothetical protein OSA81_04250 [Longimicrobiales bacterium]|nr:hypothetical protein [Longimicrobiales bacterium]